MTRPYNEERVRQAYRDEGWGQLAESEGADPIHVESQARAVYQWAWDKGLRPNTPTSPVTSIPLTGKLSAAQADELRAIVYNQRNALSVYAHELCEGWCARGGIWGDCGGCRARYVLQGGLNSSAPGAGNTIGEPREQG